MSYILIRLDESYRSTKTEDVSVRGALTIEHILPQNWIENWPLSSGEVGLSWEELWDANEGDARAQATRHRNMMLHTMGNLTVMTAGLNSAVSNAHWREKRPQLLKHSLLPINLELADRNEWDEDAILQRGKEMFERGVAIWPRPQDF